MSDSLGDRMKQYEYDFSYTVPRDMPIMMRLDGKAFHTYTRGLEKPFSQLIIDAMWETAMVLCSEIQNARLAYIQSDEITILIYPRRLFESEPWFGNKIQKMVSVSAGIASGVMSLESNKIFSKPKRACFDSRVWVLPSHEVCNAFIWRQQDWTRNSVQMLARSLYSHSILHGKDNSELQEMCFKQGRNWNDLPLYLRRGACLVRKQYTAPSNSHPFRSPDESGEPSIRYKWVVDKNIPIFSQDRNYIDKHLEVLETE